MITIVANNGSMSFSPNPATVSVGQGVVWKNSDSIVHTSTADGGAWNTGNINAGATSAVQTVGTAGTYGYHCSRHPTMVGTLIVN